MNARGYPFGLRGVAIPILLWAVFTPFSPWLDLETSRLFYQQSAFSTASFWQGVYLYGLWPAWMMMGAALAGFLLSIFERFKSWRRPCGYLMLTFGVGSGLIIEAGFKSHWERPRPRQILEFGGSYPFQPYYRFVRAAPRWTLSQDVPPPSSDNGRPKGAAIAKNMPALPPIGKSFPSGHAASGYCFFALALLGIVYQRPLLYWGGLGLAWGLGGVLSAARMAQGGHFLSDVLASALIMWLTAWGLAVIFLPRNPSGSRGGHPGRNELTAPQPQL